MSNHPEERHSEIEYAFLPINRSDNPIYLVDSTECELQFRGEKSKGEKSEEDIG